MIISIYLFTIEHFGPPNCYAGVCACVRRQSCWNNTEDERTGALLLFFTACLV